MRADRGAVDGARVDSDRGALELSVIGGGRARGVCGSGLIALADELFRARWIDRGGRFTDRLPAHLRAQGKWGTACYLNRITYVDLADLAGYMDEFVGASFLPHTSPELLHLGAG